LNEFVNQKNKTNVIIVTAPHRHDLLATWFATTHENCILAINI
jgi:alkaline phosphatase